MASRFFAIGTVAVLTTVAAVAAVSTIRHPHLRPSAAPGTARLHAFGSRGPLQRQSGARAKFDGPLADLTRHAAQVRTDHAIEDLHSLAPGVRFMQNPAGASPLVLVDAVTRGDPEKLKAALVGLGLQHPAVYSNDVGGWLPVAQLDAATTMAEVHSIRAAMPHTRSGAVTSQGDFAQHSDLVRSANSLDGTGVTVGVLSDSYNCYAVYAANNVPAAGAAGYANNGFLATAANDITTGDLPASVNVLEEALAGSGGCMNYGAPTQLPLSDEGRAMLQIVHDVAPGAGLAFYTGYNSEADFAVGIGKLAASVASGGAGAQIIADDLGYFDEPFFQDGIVAQAIDAVATQGVAYFSAAGNDGTLAYDNLTPKFSTVSTQTFNSGEQLLNFDASGATTATSLPVTIASLIPGEFVAIVVQWDQPYVTGAPNSGGATSQIDVCVTGASNSDQIINYGGTTATCSGPNALGTDPYQVMLVGIPANASGNSAAENINIYVGLANGTPAPGHIKVAVEDDGAGSTINAFPGLSTGPTLQGHPGAAGAAAVGAVFYLNTQSCSPTYSILESFSSEGGSPILFDVDGKRLAIPIVRQKPDFVAPDGGNDTFLGFTLASQSIDATTSITGCENNPSYPNFFGTSAATPHAASIAALMLQAKPAITPTQIYQALKISALSVGLGGLPDFDAGYGFIQADRAFIAPVMSLSASAVPAGGSATLTWSTVEGASCTASGNWTGPVASSGSQTVTTAGFGPAAYGLTCGNADHVDSMNTIYLTDVAPEMPDINISSSSIGFGQSTVITWSSTNAASCTASGSWTGTLGTYGRQTVTPTSAGTDTYSISCSNTQGTSSVNSVMLTVIALPAAPTLTLSASSIVVGSSATLTWSSANATGCTASGSWTGAQPTSGTMTETPTTAGSYTYSLACSNTVGTSSATSVTLTVTAPAKSGGGGGMDVLALLGLAGLGVARILRFRSRDNLMP